MKSNYKRDIYKDFFRPLSSYEYFPRFANKDQIELAERLSGIYGIPEGNMLRLIMYVDIAYSLALNKEIKYYYSDEKEILNFEQKPEPIQSILFKGKDKSIEITNPYLIDKIYKDCFMYYKQPEVIQYKSYSPQSTNKYNHNAMLPINDKKTFPFGNIIKMIATDIYNELTKEYKLIERQACCVIGNIYVFYHIHLKYEEPILNEIEFIEKNQKDEAKEQIITEKDYSSYLRNRIISYIAKSKKK